MAFRLALPMCLLVALVTPSLTSDLDHLYRHNITGTENEPHSREKRFLAYNYDEKRITMPPGTIFILTPTLLVPFLRNLPKGYSSDMTISIPFKMTFDDFGITDEYNPWGLIPGISIQAGRENGEEGRENPEEGDGEHADDGKDVKDGGQAAAGAGGAADDEAGDYDYADYPTGASGHATGTGAGHATGTGAGHATGTGAGHATGTGGGHATGTGAGHATGTGAGHTGTGVGQGGGHGGGHGGYFAVFGGNDGGYGGGHGEHGGNDAHNHYYRSSQPHHRYKRSRENYNPHPLGDRLVMFEMIEDYLMNLGHDGKACLLRAICETNEHPLPYHGLFGEFLQMLFRVSLTPYAEDVLPEYVKAEKAGSERGACWEYYKDCKKSLYSTVTENKYRRPANLKHIKERMEAGDTLRQFDKSKLHGA